MLNPSRSRSDNTSIRKPIPFLDLAKSIEPFRQEIDRILADVIDHSSFIQGSYLDSFEKNFAAFVGEGSHVVGCANGTDAITLAARALDFPKGSVAIVPAMTYVATAAALEAAGMKLKLVDVEDGTWLMNLEQLEEALDDDVRLVVPVHLYGQMPAMDRLSTLVEKADCYILEDAAQAQGATWKGKPVGYWGDIATFSFFPGKNLGAFGDAGGILSRNDEWIQKCRMIGNQGGLKKYEHTVVGCNSRLDNIQAGVLDAKLKHLEAWNIRRREIAHYYIRELQGLKGLQLPTLVKDAGHVYHQFVVCYSDREGLKKFLTEKGVQTGVHYPKALHQLPAFAERDFAKQKFPVAEKLAAHCLSLPICPTLNDSEVQYVVDTVRSFFK